MAALTIQYNRQVILGQGGFGIVFQGIWGSQDVAVKRVQLHDLSNDSSREEQLLSLDDHPNVVKLLHVERDEDFRYFAFELCAASMDKIFLPDTDAKKYTGPLPSDEDVVIQLAKGLSYIHSKEFAHRDVNPQNVLISREEPITMKWADFGLSKTVNERGSFSISKRIGKPLWTAPEIEKSAGNELNDKKNRPRGTVRSDTWSAGCLFFWYLTKGTHPYGNVREVKKVTKNISQGNRLNWTSLTSNPLTQPFGQVIESMLAVQTEARPTMDRVVTLLEGLKPTFIAMREREDTLDSR